MYICYKKIISGTALATLLAFFPGHSFSREVGNTPGGPVEGDIMSNTYVALQYHGSFFNNIGEFKGQEDAVKVAKGKILGWNKDGKTPQDYKPEYKASPFAGSAVVGMAVQEGIRIELEGLYSKTNINDTDFEEKEKASYAELQRDNDSSGSTMKADHATPSLASAWASIDTTLRKDATPADIPDSRLAAFKMKNEGFRNIIGMVNVHYDIMLGEDIPVTPYLGVGLGFGQIKFLGKERYAPAYQGKVGISYGIPNSPARIFAGYRYFGVWGDKFEKVKPTTEITTTAAGGGVGDQPARIASTTATITNSFAVHGIEAGVMVNF